MIARIRWSWPVVLLAASAAPAGETPDVGEIVEKANRVAYYQGDDGRADVNMSIIDAQDRERTRQFTILRRDNRPPEDRAHQEAPEEYTGDQRFYVYFNAPPDVSNTVFMVWKHVDMDSDDDRWLYLPDLDLVKRIAASDERTSFVGSHFFQILTAEPGSLSTSRSLSCQRQPFRPLPG